MFEKFFEWFIPRVGELIVDGAQKNLNSIKDFEVKLNTLQKNLKSLQAKTSDVEEEIKKAELFGQKKRKRAVENWLEEVESIEKKVAELEREVESEGFISRFVFGGEAEQLNEQFCKLVEQTPRCGELVVDDCKGLTLLTGRMVGGAFEKNLERIWNLLGRGDVSSIGIHGMSGAGKTTLAMHIHNRLVKQSQVDVFWVTVSQEFTIKSLQNKIAHSLGVNLLDEDEEIIRAARLNESLSKMRKSVLIFDDVWDKIDLLKLGCNFSAESCRLIISSRSLQVCRQIGCQELITVKKLEDDEAWKLFNETLGNEIILDSRLEEIARSVAKLCDGLPLGIIVLAGSMKGETSIRTWADTLAELKDHVVANDDKGKVEILHVLKKSFDRLNNQEQLCFLYCSFFPEDCKIRREGLVRNFISEGLVDEKRRRRREKVLKGHTVLDKLVNVCLLESCEHSYVKMHDLVRETALHITEGKYMVRAGESLRRIPMEEEWSKDLEKVSLMVNKLQIIEDGTSPNCPFLSTLLLQYNEDLHVIPNSFFSKMQGLCTHNLSETKVRMLPDSISDLTSLKVLLLMCCENLDYVPNLGKLRALRELDLSYTSITKVPQGLEELCNLIFLSINNARLEVLPRGLLFKLVRLQCVRLPSDLEVAIEEIVNLKELEEFWGRVKNVGDFHSFITNKGHDTFYKIHVRREYEEDDEDYWVPDFDVDYSIILAMSKCNLDDEKVLGHDIELLRIWECEGLSNCVLDQFNNPTSLRKLEVTCCGGMECLLRSDDQELASQISNLEYIDLSELDDFEGLIKKGEIGPSTAPTQAVFSSLKSLSIYKCNKMRNLGIPVLGFPNLEDIIIRHCEEVEEIFEDEGRTSLTLSKLRRLDLVDLPRLQSVCKAAAIICNSIQNISFLECPGLMKKMPLHLDDPPQTTLRHIWVEREWWEALEWDNPNHPTLLQPFVKF